MADTKFNNPTKPVVVGGKNVDSHTAEALDPNNPPKAQPAPPPAPTANAPKTGN